MRCTSQVMKNPTTLGGGFRGNPPSMTWQISGWWTHSAQGKIMNISGSIGTIGLVKAVEFTQIHLSNYNWETWAGEEVYPMLRGCNRILGEAVSLFGDHVFPMYIPQLNGKISGVQLNPQNHQGIVYNTIYSFCPFSLYHSKHTPFLYHSEHRDFV